jgi:hypothetical protein
MRGTVRDETPESYGPWGGLAKGSGPLYFSLALR